MKVIKQVTLNNEKKLWWKSGNENNDLNVKRYLTQEERNVISS